MSAVDPVSSSTPSVYLDWNATSPPLPQVLDAMRAAASEAWGNPSSVHGSGRRARAVVEDAREAIAVLASAHPRDVILTSGATEANNLALHAASWLITSRLEHPSVVRIAEALERAGRRVAWLPVGDTGYVEPEAVRAALREAPPGALVAVMAVNHETGVIQPVSGVADVVRERGGKLHVDAVQAAGKLSPEVWQVGDTLSLAAHKLRGPKGIGALVLRSPGVLEPLLVGGAQERGFRPGTVDPVGAAGFAAAARHVIAGGAERARQLEPLRDRLEGALARFGRVNGVPGRRAPHVTNLSFDGWRGDELVAALDLAGVHVASGSACSAGTSEASPVITAMLGHTRAASAVRVSLGETTSSEDVDRAIAVFIRVLGRKI